MGSCECSFLQALLLPRSGLFEQDRREAPSRRGVLMSISMGPRRHGRRVPLAVSLSRLQVPQKWPVIGSMTPMRPLALARRNMALGTVGWLTLFLMQRSQGLLYRLQNITCRKRLGRSRDRVRPKGMRSINRTSRGRSSVNRANSGTSASFTPSRSTTLIFTG